MKTHLSYIILLSLFSISLLAQPDIKYWDKAGYIKIDVGSVVPGKDFSNNSNTGLFAKNGYQVGMDLNYMIAYGWGLGFNLQYNNFGFDKEAFASYAKPQTMRVKGGYGSTKYALNVLFNMPVMLNSDKLVLNFYGLGSAGFRNMNIPEIDLTYNEVANKFVEVSYRPRSNTMGYLGYSAGIQFLFSNKYGVNIAYNAVLPSRHSIKYSARMFDANGKLFEDENFLHDYLDHTGIQVGFIFIMGKD